MEEIQKKGFALISTIIVLSLLMLIAVGSLSISRLETRSSTDSVAQIEAEANARIALMEAISRLQETAGQDQRVTARAAILEDPDGSDTLPNRNWLGVWKTTHEAGDREWPIIGKAPDLSKSDEPYSYKGIYTDLRYQDSELSSNKWRDKLRLAWLVSSRTGDVNTALDPNDPTDNALEILGRRTLGESSVVDQASYLRDRVVVEKININTLGKSGAYAWYISDNSQKASLRLGSPSAQDLGKALASSALDNPTAITLDGSEPYSDYLTDAAGKIDKVLSHQTTPLTGGTEINQKKIKDALGAHVHHFTTDSGGLFTDPVFGGFKKDLTPLVFGNPSQKRIDFSPPYAELADHPFNSRYPIIPGQRKAAQGPSFAALRDWGKMKTSSSTVTAQLTTPNSASRITPTDGWVYGISDGKSFKASEWAESVPKLRPVMTDCRYHYYFSFTGTGADQKMRTHLIPRVCIWNPYNVTMEVDEMTVLMANPFGAKNFEKQFHFIFTVAEVDRLKKLFISDTEHVVHKWNNQKIYLRGNEGGLFPADRFLGFQLEKSSLAPGECLVFSPKVNQVAESSQGIDIQYYDVNDVSKNILSAREPQGAAHFVHDYASSFKKYGNIKENGKTSKLVLPNDFWKELRLDEINRYESWVYMKDNFTFALKEGVAVNTATEASKSLTNLQTMNHGNGGTKTYEFWYYSSNWGDSGAAFGNLARFTEAPRKDAPRLHQIGTKLLWLDESTTEANDRDPVPLRLNVWNSESLAYNPSVIANWNVRPHLITRSPSSPVGQINGRDTWYTTGSGAWLQQYAPKSPQDLNDMPILTDSVYFAKPALTLATQPGVPANMVLFDLPDPDYGALSLGNLRHAQLSPFSWHPTYIVGHSLADFHAPFDASSHSEHFEESYSDGKVNTGWDFAVGGGNNGSPYSHGARVSSVDSDSLMQIGKYKTSIELNGTTVTHADEHLVYDISYEVNQNLWDHFFFSGMQMNSSADGFEWNFAGETPLHQLRYQAHQSTTIDKESIEGKLSSSLDHGFWLNGYLLQNKAAFNVNSTSVEAWTAFLSGLRAIDRNGIKAGDDSIISRLRNPSGAAITADVDVESPDGWKGSRKLTDVEISNLATNIVREVKLRGPFVSLSDFVNRRLAPKSDKSSYRGALESAIMESGLNDNFNNSTYLTTTGSQNDNNHEDFKPDLDKQTKSKAWGIPGFITQADILEPFAPAMTVRGDVFVIRCYGEARSFSGEVTATAYLEAIVERTAEYVSSTPVETASLNPGSNRATDPALKLDYRTGKLEQGNLSDVNKKYGRKFVIKSVRWMSKDEI